MKDATRRGFIGCAAGLLLSGCASVPNFGFAGKTQKFMDTELGQMIAKGVADELAMHANTPANEKEAENAVRDVDGWLDHMKENGYIVKYAVQILYSENTSFGIRVVIKPLSGECVVLDYSIRFKV